MLPARCLGSSAGHRAGASALRLIVGEREQVIAGDARDGLDDPATNGSTAPGSHVHT